MRNVRLSCNALPGLDWIATTAKQIFYIEWRLTLAGIIDLGIIVGIGVALYKTGKREGSRKGFGVGRYRHK